MYAFIEGKVCEKNAGELILLAGGVGYQINCSMNTLAAAPAVGETMRCYTWLSVREDAMELFGFASREERRMFLSLTGVTGVGAKTALALLGSMPLKDLNLAILLGDVTTLSRAPGIGKKTAQRIALDWKDKVTAATAHAMSADCVTEALEALQALGYTPGEARNAIQSVRDQSDKTDELIKLALRSMAGM